MEDEGSYLIEAKGVKAKLGLKLIKDLYPHEEVEENILERMKNDILITGYLNEPIIIDAFSNVILDGMHRYEALKRIGCKSIPCLMFDYNIPEIKIKKWIRKVKNYEESKIRKYINKIKDIKNLDIKENYKSIKEIIENKLFIIYRNKLFFKDEIDLNENFAIIRELDREFRESLEFIEDDKIEEFEEFLYFSGRRVDKKEVLEVALKGERMPLKTTRHILPFKIRNLRVPLSILMIEDKKNADREFIKFLRNVDNSIKLYY